MKKLILALMLMFSFTANAALVWSDKVMETTTTTGTGALTLGGAVSGYVSFSSGIGNSNTCYYGIKGATGTEWETGFGTLNSSSTTLTRTTVHKSSNANAAVSFSAGTKYVFVDITATAIKQRMTGADLTNGQIIIGSTGADPVTATLTAGSGINITNGAGSISVATGTVSAVCTSNLAKTSSTVYADITGMTATLEASTTYIFEAEVYIQEASTTAGYKIGSDQGTATFTSAKGGYQLFNSSATGQPIQFTTLNAATLITGVGGATTADTGNKISIKCGCETTNAGTFKFQGAQNTSDGNTTTFLAKSWMRFTKVQ